VAVESFILLQEADAILGNEDPARLQAAFAAFFITCSLYSAEWRE
jgi:hypothetical protein